MKSLWRAVALGPALMLGGMLQAAEAPQWLHVQVTEGGEKAAKVSVNLPLSLIDVALDVVNQEPLKNGRVQLEDTEMKVADLRRMWAELKKAGDTEFVTVEEKNESVRIERKGERVQVRITDKPAGKEKVRVDVPLSVVDALLSGEGESLNLRAAMQELKRATNGDFIHVDDGDSRVRVWID